MHLDFVIWTAEQYWPPGVTSDLLTSRGASQLKPWTDTEVMSASLVCIVSLRHQMMILGDTNTDSQ